MTRLLLSAGALVCLLSAAAADDRRVIYGEDGRQDEYEVSTTWQDYGATTAALVSVDDLETSGDDYSLPSGLLSTWGVCEDERFTDQPNPGFCSGFLIGDNLFATAGHCMDSAESCGSTAFVFDFYVDDPNNLPCSGDSCSIPVSSSNVYFCDEVLGKAYDYHYGDSQAVDYAVVRLDRAVTGRTFATISADGDNATPDVGDDLLLIGHPSGLPRKYAPGKVYNNSPFYVVEANVDAFGGNSGSAVFNSATGEIEGILISGATDYVYDDSEGCSRPNVCDEVPGGDDCGGEQITRADILRPYLVLDSDGCTAPEDCSGYACSDGECLCPAGAYGPDCSSTCDEHNCNGNGVCTGHYQCECNEGYSGDLCSEGGPSESSPSNTSTDTDTDTSESPTSPTSPESPESDAIPDSFPEGASSYLIFENGELKDFTDGGYTFSLTIGAGEWVSGDCLDDFDPSEVESESFSTTDSESETSQSVEFPESSSTDTENFAKGHGNNGNHGNQKEPDTCLLFSNTTAVTLDDVSTFSADASAANGFSVSFWAKATECSTGETRQAFSSDLSSSAIPAAAYLPNSAGALEFVVGGPVATLNATACSYYASSWRYWVFVYSGSNQTQTVYRDGAMVAQSTVAPASIGDITSFVIGSTSGNGFVGMIDAFSVFAEPLPEMEVAKAYEGYVAYFTVEEPQEEESDSDAYVIGGAVGGAVGAVVIAAGIIYYRRRSRANDDEVGLVPYNAA